MRSLVHGDHAQLGEAGVGDLGVHERLRNDPDHLAAGREHGVGQHAHRADRRAAVHDPDAPAGQRLGQRAGDAQVLRPAARVGAAEDADGAHARSIGTGGGGRAGYCGQPMSATHPTAAAGFARAADAYERGRPGYPPEAIAHLVAELGLWDGTTVLDLAAGTGKLTRVLQATGATVIAVEPVEAMRRVLSEAVPGVEVRAGTAEAIPVADGSLDAVTVAQAFHWFDAGRALHEIYRTLRPGGGLGLIWNMFDTSIDWVAALQALVHAHQRGEPQYGRSPGARSSRRAASSSP